MDKLILLSGPLAVGKTSVRKVLVANFGYEFVPSSQFLRDLAARKAQSDNRTELQDLGDRLDRDSDYRWVIDDVFIPALRRLPGQRLWLFDSVRKFRQVEHFRNDFGESVVHIHLDAAERVLRQQYTERQKLSGVHDDKIPYETAISHTNEIEARGLSDIADAIINVEGRTALETASLIVEFCSKY